jgi:hypothetical protein
METSVDYRVRNMQDDTWQVVRRDFAYDGVHDGYYEEIEYQGSLADCEAYIKLKEGGYM